MSGSKLEYSEYKDLVNILEASNVDDSYQKLMGKEDKVLDTINRSIKYYRDEKQKEKEFIHLDILEIVMRFINTWIDIIKEFIEIKDISDPPKILLSRDRPIYVGIMLIIVSILIYLIEITK